MIRRGFLSGAFGALIGLSTTAQGATMATDSELRDQGVAALKRTTVSYPEWVKRRDAGRYADIKTTEWWKAFDAFEKIGVVVEPPPPPPPSGDVAPERSTTVTGQSGLTAKNDTRYIDCPSLSIPIGLSRCTIIGSQFPSTTTLKGVQDVWIEGRPDAYMNCGPRSDGGDLLQIKVNPSGYAPTDKLVLRWINFHDATRPSGSTAHTDAIQIMALTNSRFTELSILDNFQGIQMATNMTPSQGFGPIHNNLFEQISFRESSTNGSPWAANFGAGTGGSITGNTVKDLVCLDGASVLVREGWVANGNLIVNCPCAKVM